MEASLQQTERTYIRLIAWFVASFFFVVFLCWGIAGIYHRWEEKDVLRRAAAYLSEGDVRTAVLSARRAYQLNPDSPAAARMLAQVAEAAGERAALDWRRKVLQLEPGSAVDQIALAKCALRFEEISTAENALARIGNEGKSAAYHAVAAQVAEAARQTTEARDHWARAAALDPEERSYQVRLAAVSLTLPDAGMREAARAALAELRQDHSQRAAATRALIADGATHRQDPAELMKLARELQAYPESTFNDALLYLDMLRQLRSADFMPYLSEVEQKVAERPNELASLISWMNKRGLSALALDFVASAKPEALAAWPVPLAVAETYSVRADWGGLERWTTAHPWGGFEFLRRAYLARALRAQQKSEPANREWNAAKKEAAEQPRLLALLTRTLIDWRWTDEAIDLLWTLAKDPAEQNAVLRGLYRHFADTGDTGGLYRTLVRLVETMPEDLSLQNNLAQIGLLLGADPDRARRIAGDLYRKNPDEPAYVSTYAFSLFSNGDAAGAVQAMASLKEEQLRDPAIATYYGVFLASAGQPEKARVYLKLGAAAQLFPEEKALVERAEAKLD